MLLGGLWHGAAINFVLWGAWHGVLLALSRQSDRHATTQPGWRTWWNRFVCFQLICFGWLLFRVSSWEQFVAYVSGLLQFTGGSVLHHYVYLLLTLAFAMHVFPKDRQLSLVLQQWPQRAPRLVQAATYAMLLLLVVGFTLDAPAFIYFQF